MLQTEHGGMTEVLANLYAVTGDARTRPAQAVRAPRHHRSARPRRRSARRRPRQHADPEDIGAAREYELTGDTRYRDIATFFWDRVAHHRSFAFGGNSDGEAFFPEAETSRHLGAEGPETCNTYNMLKLTRHLFAWSPSAETMDFYERALFNHILGSQDPKTGMVIYYCPLKPEDSRPSRRRPIRSGAVSEPEWRITASTTTRSTSTTPTRSTSTCSFPPR